MGKIAYVFPGQGAQTVGMGRDVYEADERAREIFQLADEKLGYKLSNLIFEGPEEQLRVTYHTQPALLTVSMAILAAMNDYGVKVDYVAGHSLGEYSALVTSGALAFGDAVQVVKKRGEYMDRAVPAGLGAMAAVLGAEREPLGALCEEISASVGTVELANVNCPGQIVVSGSREGVNALAERGKEAGAKRIIPLDVSGPFHSSLMKGAAEHLGETLAMTSWSSMRIPVISNVTANSVTDVDTMQRLLVEQVYSPVLWEDSVRTLIDSGVDTFVEIGSGSVLSGLIRKINRDVQIYTINNMGSIESFLKEAQSVC